MSRTILERDMLKTRLLERGLDVTTFLHTYHARGCPPWTAVWQHAQPGPRPVWLHFWRGPVTPGGLAEAHEQIVSQARAGTLPLRQKDSGTTLDGLRGRDPDGYDRIARARPEPAEREEQR